MASIQDLQDLQALSEEMLLKIGEKDVEIDKIRKEADEAKLRLAVAEKVAKGLKEQVDKKTDTMEQQAMLQEKVAEKIWDLRR